MNTNRILLIERRSKHLWIINDIEIDTRRVETWLGRRPGLRSALTGYYIARGHSGLRADSIYCKLHNNWFEPTFNMIDAATKMRPIHIYWTTTFTDGGMPVQRSIKGPSRLYPQTTPLPLP